LAEFVPKPSERPDKHQGLKRNESGGPGRRTFGQSNRQGAENQNGRGKYAATLQWPNVACRPRAEALLPAQNIDRSTNGEEEYSEP
jgi:hypothetical protein